MSTLWKKDAIRPRAADEPRVDPYYEWVRTTKYVYYGQHGESVPVLIELREAMSPVAFADLVSAAHAPPALGGLRVPKFYREPVAQLHGQPIRYFAVLATKAALEAVADGDPAAKVIKRFEVGRAVELNDKPLPQAPSQPIKRKHGEEECPEFVIAVIDDGIAFAHDRFWDSDGNTRIEYFWDQVMPSPHWGYLGYGREISKRHPSDGIDQRMANSRRGSLIDEDEVYRLSGHFDQRTYGHKPLARRAAHGAHVMDLACSLPAARPAAGKLPIIAVQLPVPTVADTSGATLAPQVYNGLFYALVRANSIAYAAGSGPLAVVANVSYGTIAGPHDGKTLLEAATDELIRICDPPLRVVLPAGNNHLSRCHARFSLAPKQSRTLLWRVLPDDWTESFLEIWLPSPLNVSPVEIIVTAPDGTSSTRTSPGNQQWCVLGSAIVGQASYYPPDYVGTRAVLRLSIAPTGSPDSGVPLSPAGLWRVELKNDGRKAAHVRDIHAWIQRDDAAPGYARRGRQSFFDDPAYRRLDDGGRAIEDDNDPRTVASDVKRRYTLNAIATGRKTIVIGGFRRSDWKPAPDSASGPALWPGRSTAASPGPDAMWPSETTPSHHGVLGAGTRSGSCVAMNGTSVAAPRAANWIAEQWEAGVPHKSIDRDAVYSYAANADAGPDRPSAERGGGGRVPDRPVRRRPRCED